MSQEKVKALPAIGFVEATKRGFKNLFNFKGRARRSEFWWFVSPWSIVLSVLLLAIFIPILDSLCVPYRADMTDEEYQLMEMKNIPYDFLGFLIPIFLILMFTWSSLTRRLHDINIGNWLGCSSITLFLMGIVWFYSVYYYDPIGFYALLDVELPEPSKGISVYWYIFPAALCLISLLATFVSLVFCLLDSQKESNRYGKSPKYVKD